MVTEGNRLIKPRCVCVCGGWTSVLMGLEITNEQMRAVRKLRPHCGHGHSKAMGQTVLKVCSRGLFEEAVLE